jgi:cellulose synthase/poly-beta-1,6-N-acetylglucosamine synthase-like glycosyltransferase
VTAVLFWISLALVAYIYVGYPSLAWLLARLVGKPVRKADYEPSVTVVIAAHNEAGDIERTVRNKLEQDYAAAKLNVIVVSDASTDGTDDIVRGLGDRVKLIRQEPRAGKTAGLNLAVPKAAGEILVFSDANSAYAPDAIRRLVRNFADPTVGYVTGKMVYTNPDGTLIGDGCSAYMRYENFLRGQESLLASVIGVDGGIDATRRALYRPLDTEDQSDFVLPLAIAGDGLRVVYDSDAVLKEAALGDQAAEYRMRVRVALRAMWALWGQRHLLLPAPRPLLAWQIWSHKVLRYVAFFPIITAMASCAVLAATSGFYLALLIIALLLVAAGIWAWIRGGRTNRLALLPYYFLLLNVTSLHAFLKLLSGKKQVLWVPRTG